MQTSPNLDCSSWVAAAPLDRDDLVALIELYAGDLLPSCYDDRV